jgi:CO/xanthine dehydrogenase Mo-binding subunit
MALYEQVLYDTEGQPLKGSFMDYLLRPRPSPSTA